MTVFNSCLRQEEKAEKLKALREAGNMDAFEDLSHLPTVEQMEAIVESQSDNSDEEDN